MIIEKYGDYELSSYDGVELTLPDFVVSDDEVRTEMERIAARHASHVDIDPHPINANDMVRISIKTTEGDISFPGLTNDGIDVQLGVGSLPTEVEIAMLSHNVGDVVEADFDYTDYSAVASDREKPTDGGCGGQGGGEGGEPETVKLHSTVKILALRALNVPELTDEWVAGHIALSNSVEEFAARTRKRLETQRRRDYANQVEYDIINLIGDRLIGEPPAEIVENLHKQIKREFESFLKPYEISIEEYVVTQGMTSEQFEAQMLKDAHDRIAQDIALASYAKHFDIELDDEDINAMFSKPTPEQTYEARRDAEATGQIDDIKDLALRAKVTEMLTRSATYRTADGTVDESFKKDIDEKYRKLQAVRDHATAAPMMPKLNTPETAAAMEARINLN